MLYEVITLIGIRRARLQPGTRGQIEDFADTLILATAIDHQFRHPVWLLQGAAHRMQPEDPVSRGRHQADFERLRRRRFLVVDDSALALALAGLEPLPDWVSAVPGFGLPDLRERFFWAVFRLSRAGTKSILRSSRFTLATTIVSGSPRRSTLPVRSPVSRFV